MTDYYVLELKLKLAHYPMYIIYMKDKKCLQEPPLKQISKNMTDYYIHELKDKHNIRCIYICII